MSSSDFSHRNGKTHYLRHKMALMGKPYIHRCWAKPITKLGSALFASLIFEEYTTGEDCIDRTTITGHHWVRLNITGKRKVGVIRYEARSRGRLSPDTLAFWACGTSRRWSRLLPGLQFPPLVRTLCTRFHSNDFIISWDFSNIVHVLTPKFSISVLNRSVIDIRFTDIHYKDPL